jgi:hypothetical protein
MNMSRLGPIGAALALAACQSETNAPWLTMPTPEQHAARFFPTTPDSAHAAFTCDDCHTDPATFRTFDCLSCHTGAHSDEAAVTASHSGVPGFQFASPACYGCHPTGVGVNHEPIFPIASGAHASVACAQCHLDPTDRSVLGCAGCHPHTKTETDGRHSEVSDYSWDSSACYGCHPGGVAGD